MILGYARVSTDKAEQDISIEAQVQQLYAAGHWLCPLVRRAGLAAVYAKTDGPTTQAKALRARQAAELAQAVKSEAVSTDALQWVTAN